MTDEMPAPTMLRLIWNKVSEMAMAMIPLAKRMSTSRVEPGQRDDQLLYRLFGNSLKPRHAADGQECDVAGGHPEPARRQCMAQFV